MIIIIISTYHIHLLIPWRFELFHGSEAMQI